MKNAVFAMLVLAILSTQAAAQMGGGSMGHGMMGEPRQQDEWRDGRGSGRDDGRGEIYQPQPRQFPGENEELRRDIDSKKSELLQALRNPEATREKIIRLEQELRNLMLELYE